MAKVSIVIPIYNAQKYLRQCLDSVTGQTLTDIEIVCVNDGSADSSLDIIKEYAARDGRVVVIDKPNSGYGSSMNRGLDAATGEYVGIVESDDFADVRMFEKLYASAKENDLDVCKGGFFFYHSPPDERAVPYPMPADAVKRGVFSPLYDFASPGRQVRFFNIQPSIWSAIYKRSFLSENAIRFTETPGASYQDTAFNFKVWALAKRVMLLRDCFIYYRQDNGGSSIHSASKIYAVAEEYGEIERFMEDHEELKAHLVPVKNALKFFAYLWNYERLSADRALEFLLFASDELSGDMKAGGCVRRAYGIKAWNTLRLIINNPQKYHEMRQRERQLTCGGIINTVRLLFLKIKRRLSRK